MLFLQHKTMIHFHNSIKNKTDWELPQSAYLTLLYHLKHLLRHRLLPLRPFQFLSGILQIFQPFQFILCILKVQMRISVKSNPYMGHSDIGVTLNTMPHKILQRLRVHSGFRHIAAIRVPANMWRDIRHLHPIDIVVPLHHVVKAMFPMHCH